MLRQMSAAFCGVLIIFACSVPTKAAAEACTFGDPHEGASRRYQAAAIHRRCLNLQSLSSRPRRRRQADRVWRKLQREQLDCRDSNESARVL